MFRQSRNSTYQLLSLSQQFQAVVLKHFFPATLGHKSL
jgi:hypothetical protein